MNEMKLKKDISTHVSKHILSDLANIVADYILVDDWYKGYYLIEEDLISLDYMIGALESRYINHISKLLHQNISLRPTKPEETALVCNLIKPLIRYSDKRFVKDLFNVTNYFDDKDRSTLYQLLVKEMVSEKRFDLIYPNVDHISLAIVRQAASAETLETCQDILHNARSIYGRRESVIAEIESGAVENKRVEIIEWLLDKVSKPYSILDKGIRYDSEIAVKMVIEKHPSLYNKYVKSSYPYLLDQQK